MDFHDPFVVYTTNDPTTANLIHVNAFKSRGWTVARQRGSHIVLVKEGENSSLSVPDHREVAKQGRERHPGMCG